jgi:Domain of unknown function (DUF4232)
MKCFSRIPKSARRAAALIAVVSAAGLFAVSAAVAVGPSGAVPGAGARLAADTARASAAVPACAAADLGVWVAVTQGNGAAGKIVYPLEFTNLSRQACTLRGFPGVSAVDRNLRQLGSPARWDHVFPVRTVMLAPGATAHTLLRWSDATVSTAPGCHPTSRTYELRIYPPNRYKASYAAFDLEACSHTGPAYLGVEPIRPGVGTIDG